MHPTAEPLRNGFTAQRKNADTLVSATAILAHDPLQIEQFVERTLRVLSEHYQYYELLLIDNGSPLEIHACVQELQSRLPNVRLLRLSRRYTVEVAMAAALDHCIGDYVVLLDSLIHPPEAIPRLVDRLMEGLDSVTAIPTVQREGFWDRLVIRRAYRLASRILRVPVEPNESYYKAFSRRLVNSMVRIRSKNRYLSYLNASMGLRKGTITYEPETFPPAEPVLRRVFRKLIMVSDLLVSNSAVPLRFASALGLLASVLNLFYLEYILVVTLVKRRIAEGWLTTSLTQTVMFMVLFLIMTILSEYVSRILDETKEQPLYFVECEQNSTVSGLNRDRLNVVDEAVHPPQVGAAGA